MRQKRKQIVAALRSALRFIEREHEVLADCSRNLNTGKIDDPEDLAEFKDNLRLIHKVEQAIELAKR